MILCPIGMYIVIVKLSYGIKAFEWIWYLMSYKRNAISVILKYRFVIWPTGMYSKIKLYWKIVSKPVHGFSESFHTYMGIIRYDSQSKFDLLFNIA